MHPLFPIAIDRRRLAVGCVLVLAPATHYALALAPGTGEWAGAYEGPWYTLTIGRDGRFEWQGRHAFGGGDATTVVRGRGTATRQGSTLRLAFDPASFVDANGQRRLDGFERPSSWSFDVATVAGTRYLLDERDAASIVNGFNGYGTTSRNAGELVRQTSGVATGGDPGKAVDVVAMLPARWRERLLRLPVQGKVISVGPIGQTQLLAGACMQPATPAVQQFARVTFDVGRAQRIFLGMDLHIRPSGWTVVVDQLQDHRSEAIVRWIGGEAPAVGQRVSSAR